MTISDLLNNIGDGFIVRMKLFKFFVGKNSIIVFFETVVRIRDFQFSKFCKFAEGVPVPKFFKIYDGFIVIFFCELVHAVFREFMRRFVNIRIPVSAGGKQHTGDEHQQKRRFFHRVGHYSTLLMASSSLDLATMPVI